jgi:hypothetical protein
MKARPGGRNRWVLMGILLLALAAASSLAGARVITRTATVLLPADVGASEPSATAVCPRGSRVVLGGVRRSELAQFGAVTISRFARSGPRRWRASGVNYNSGGGPVDQDHKLTAIAYCGRSPRGRIQPVSESVTAQTVNDSGDENARVTATCPRGTRLLFGGYDQGRAPPGDMYIAAAERLAPRRWRVEAVNYGDPTSLTALAYCSARAPAVTTVTRQTTIPAGDNTATLRPRCPRGRRVLFGGFRVEASNDTLGLLNRLLKGGPRRWIVGADNSGAFTDVDLAAFAYCAKKRR